MFPYEYLDFLQLQLSSDNSFDYDFDTHVAQCANVFGLDEKGLSEDHCRPIQMILPASDGFGSSDSSSWSRSPSIAEDNIKAELSDVETSSEPLVKDNERSFDRSHTAHYPTPSARSITNRSVIPLTTLSSSGSKLLEPESLPGRKRTRKPRAFKDHLYDEDADDESDNDTDDDYIPTPRSSGPKRRRILSQPPAHHSSLPNRATSSSPVPQKHISGSFLSRNKQATSVVAIDQACSSVNLNFVCPECGWKQVNKRLPDFKRHLRTHTRPDESDQSKGWWCKGVPLEDAHKFNIPKGAKSFVFLGQERIGGCRRTFSRRDALKRHLDNANVICVGWPCEATED